MENGTETFPEDYIDVEPRQEFELFEITDDNGYVFCNKYYVPEELLSMILSYLSPTELVFICRRVCKHWCNVIDSRVWKIKLARNNLPFEKIKSFTWSDLFWILWKSPLSRNLVKNSCGQEKFRYWNILSSGGDGWTIEKPPSGCEEFPKECDREDVLMHNSCFTTSFVYCSKRQIIDLMNEGAPPDFMDFVQPHITITDWYCGRFDCRAIYKLKVKLLDENYETLEEFEVTKNVGSVGGCTWKKVSHVFKGYGPGVKYIEFFHGGVDSQFWKGNYGSKMTGALVVLSLP